MSHIVVTNDLIGDLLASVKCKLPASSSWQQSRREQVPPPPFGHVYFGSFTRFSPGRPHFGMVCGSPLGPIRGMSVQGVGPAIRMAPITSQRQRGRCVLSIPPGELPPKKGPNGERMIVESFILLHIRLLVGRMTLARDFEGVRQLPELYCAKAREILRSCP